MNPRARRAHQPDLRPDPLDDPRHDPPSDFEVDFFGEYGLSWAGEGSRIGPASFPIWAGHRAAFLAGAPSPADGSVGRVA